MPARIFSDFVQADSTITRKYGGTGLGLSICSKLTSLLGGSIAICPEKKGGTKFLVSLPLKTVEESQQETLPVSQTIELKAAILGDKGACSRGQ